MRTTKRRRKQRCRNRAEIFVGEKEKVKRNRGDKEKNRRKEANDKEGEIKNDR